MTPRGLQKVALHGIHREMSVKSLGRLDNKFIRFNICNITYVHVRAAAAGGGASAGGHTCTRRGLSRRGVRGRNGTNYIRRASCSLSEL